MTSTDAIAALIEPSLRTLGFELVQVRVMGQVRRTLQIMAEPSDPERRMTVDDCADISHTVSAILDVNDPMPGAYALEVTSPGLDRPLVRPSDYDRFAGHRARIEIEPALDGRKKFTGQLNGVVGDAVSLTGDEGEVLLPLPRIRKAKLLAEDALAARPRPDGGRRAGRHQS